MTISHVEPAEVLADQSSTLAETLRAIESLERAQRFSKEASIGLSSNTTIDLLGVFLRKQALLHDTMMRVHAGNHDDMLNDIEAFARDGVDTVLLLPFFDNLLPAFEAQVGHLPPDAIAEKEQEVRARYRLAFEKTASFRRVFLGSFHRMGTVFGSATDTVSQVVAQFNRTLREEAAGYANIRIIDTEEIVRVLGQGRAFDRRFYFRAKAPYSAAFLSELARRIASASRGFGTHFFKALVLDCDNTLWGGVIGEDLLSGIKLNPHDHPGNIFWRVQNELVSLEKSGTLLCLCSKNNPADVEEVLSQHPDMVLRNEHIIVKKLNWSDKSDNIREIAQALNIGLDSIVYLDDSDFECSGVRSQLPMVRTFQVPAVLSQYPDTIDEIKELFLAGGISRESQSKTLQYRQRADALELKARIGSNEEFLASLALRLEIARDAESSISRISELTMKSNQFNLTTRRYDAIDIRRFMENTHATVYSIVVHDRFGSAGLTGVIIMRWEGEVASVDSFLMSCRVLGRGIEFAVWDEVLRDAAAKGCRVIRATYRPTPKNAQVADFFDRLGLSLIASDDESRQYEVAVDEFRMQHTPWVEVTCV